mgnify:CR=1 FL=1
MNKGIKRIIAKEGLIFIVIAIVLYFIFLYLSPNMPVVVPKYKLIFANGESYAIDIHPEISYEDVSVPKKFLKTVQSPPSKLISKRIQEFIKLKNISSSLKEARCINSRMLSLSNTVYSFLMLNLFLKALIIYCFLLLVRFIIWAVKIFP